MEKKIISCPKCNTKVKVPVGKHIRFECPTCKEKLEFNDKVISNAQALHSDSSSEKFSFSGCVIQIIVFILSFPVFIILHKRIPDFDWVFNLDRILLFALVFLVIEIVLSYVKKLVIFLFVGIVIYLIYGSIWGQYGFINMYNDYRNMIYAMRNSPNPEQIILAELKPFPKKSEIKKAIDYENPEVRNFALSATRNHFAHYSKDGNYREYRTIIQAFAIFKEVNVVKGWNYVHDPKSREYFAKANESLEHFSGDCDDYAILMVSCIKAIGGTARLVLTETHLYPEILIGSKSDLENVNYMIQNELFKESFYKNLNKGLFIRRQYSKIDNKNIYYHIDERGQIWLNLDYTANHPGGKFIGGEVMATWEI